jgi:hypothetical protein
MREAGGQGDRKTGRQEDRTGRQEDRDKAKQDGMETSAVKMKKVGRATFFLFAWECFTFPHLANPLAKTSLGQLPCEPLRV